MDALEEWQTLSHVDIVLEVLDLIRRRMILSLILEHLWHVVVPVVHFERLCIVAEETVEALHAK